MSNLTLQNEVGQTSLHLNIERSIKETACNINGVLFIYSADGPNFMESQVNAILESQPGLAFQVWRGDEPGFIAVHLPNQPLDAVHFQGLLLKQRLQEVIGNFDPRITLTSFNKPEDVTSQVLKQMEESVKMNPSGDIHLFTNENALTLRARVLIVEGDATIREFLQIRLQMQGYETAVADNGLSALELIESWKPDLVLTELNLYGVDGLPYIHQIQQINVKNTPKIVVLTEQRVEQTISLCFQNGVDDYITKPFSPVELDARIRRCIH